MQEQKRYLDYIKCSICQNNVYGGNIAIARTKHLIDVHNFVIDPKLIQNSKRYFN